MLPRPVPECRRYAWAQRPVSAPPQGQIGGCMRREQCCAPARSGGRSTEAALLIYSEAMRDELPTSVKLSMSAWTVLFAVVAVLAVLVVSWLPGVSVLGALIVVTAIRLMFSLGSIWAYRRRRHPRSGGPEEPSGDRSPRRPLPSMPSLLRQRPLPDS